MPLEPTWLFYATFCRDFVSKLIRSLRLLVWIHQTTTRSRKHPDRHLYTDQALTSVAVDESESLELLTHSESARQAVAHARRIADLTSRTAPRARAEPAGGRVPASR